jgi:hypothetical protein
MCNSAQANPTQLGRETARLWTGTVPSPKPAPFAVDPAALEKLIGLYRKLRDNTVAEIRVRDGELMLERTALTPAGPSEFTAGERRFFFEQGRFREVTPDGDIAYERVEPVHPSAVELASLAGEYESQEIGSTVTVALKVSNLTLAIGANSPLPLRPTFRDAFMMQPPGGPTSGSTSILFRRDASGHVTGLSVGDDRVWDLRLTRVASSRAPR